MSLHDAAKNGRLARVKQLLANGADPNAKTKVKGGQAVGGGQSGWRGLWMVEVTANRHLD